MFRLLHHHKRNPLRNSMDGDTIKAESIRIDQHFDEMLVDGMDWSAAMEVERQRDLAHQQLSQRILVAASGGGVRIA